MRLHQVVYVNNLIENHFFIVTHFRKQGSYCTAIRFCRAEAFRVRTGNRNTVLIGIHQMITTSVIREESVTFINHFLPIGTFGSFVRFVREQLCSVRNSQVRIVIALSIKLPAGTISQCLDDKRLCNRLINTAISGHFVGRSIIQ